MCAHSQQVIEVQPNLDVRLVLGRLLGLEACVLLGLGHRFAQRRVFDGDAQERDQQAGKEAAHREWKVFAVGCVTMTGCNDIGFEHNRYMI